MEDKFIHVAALQLPTLGISSSRLEFYIKNAKKKDAKIILFGEYVLNHFFLELQNIPKKMIKEQTKEHLGLLEEFSKKYEITFIAPIVRIKNKKYYKTIAKISPEDTQYYSQQILINYEHWNEEEFFANKITKLKPPMIFELEGIKIAVMAGFELHFDKFWESIDKEEIDLVLLPTASTFDSNIRWREIMKTRAFLHGCYILRANRLGECNYQGVEWKFYGDSMLIGPDGKIDMILEDKESMLLEPIQKERTIKHRKMWKFTEALKKRGEL
jgi:predicted amidohydrolase